MSAIFSRTFIFLGLWLSWLLPTAELQAQASNCHANFSSSLTNCPTIDFTDLSIVSGSIVFYSWTFGDGGTAGIPSPSHTYTSNGVYEVCLNVLVDFTCPSSFCAFVTVECMDCQADFNFAMPNCPTVNFNGTSSTMVGNVVSHTLDFGDGVNDTVLNTSHTYAANGTYLACLQTVTDAGCTALRCKPIVIRCIVGAAEPQQSFEVQVAPQPLSGDQMALSVTAAQAGTLDCALYAIDGKLLRRWDLWQDAGLQRHALAFDGAAGLYLLRVTAADGDARVVRVVKE